MSQSYSNCGYKKYRNTINGECEPCHLTCKQCDGASPWNCRECDSSKFKCIREYGISCEISREICLAKTTTTTTTSTTPFFRRPVEASSTFFNNGYNLVVIFAAVVIIIGGIFIFRHYKCSKKSKVTKKSRLGSNIGEAQKEQILDEKRPERVPTLLHTEDLKSSNNPTKQNVEESVVINNEFSVETFDNEKLDWDKRVEIGAGSFGKVWKCPYRDNDGCYYVAVKEAKKQKSNVKFP
uniref:TNFR-Cys domain-containing protein n=1 Tax=Panagrolaimus sp. ES5 TaxID=591445 RepID=A0AC34GC03_9BILA